MDYLKEFKGYLNGTYVFPFEDCPLEKDLFIVGSEEFNNIIPRWKDYFSSDFSTQVPHPNNFINYKKAYCEKNDENSLSIFIEINTSYRFHGVPKMLKKSDFIFCFKFYSAGEKPFIVVNQEWINSLTTDIYSCYAMVDIIGIRNLLKENGKISKSMIEKYNKEMNILAENNPTFAFLTFTDNIFIKSNWSSSKNNYLKTYEPEIFIKTVKKVIEIVEDSYNLKSYSVFSQGIHLIDEDTDLFRNTQNNHFFIGSIATPFVELFDIESAVNKRKKNRDTTILNSMYISESLFSSLHLKDFSYRTKRLEESLDFEGKLLNGSLNKFISLDIDELINILE